VPNRSAAVPRPDDHRRAASPALPADPQPHPAVRSVPHRGTARLHPLFPAHPPPRRRAHRRDHRRLEARGALAPDGIERIEVVSVNAPDTIARLQELRPKVVLVVGTRIISRKVLSAVQAPFINYHDGITPKYRGIHGGYWASAQNDLVNFGATVHLVDPGIDTGEVLYQVRLRPSGEDNYATFSNLQLAAALPLLVRAAEDAIGGTVTPQTVELPSSVVAPDDLALLHDGRLPRGVVRDIVPTRQRTVIARLDRAIQ
jgi:hypothetical protein